MNTSRLFVLSVLAMLGLLGFNASVYAEEASTPIVAILPDLAGVAKWHDSMGDTADPFWADDDQLYHFMCDGRGFGTEKRNLCFNKLVGTELATLKGELVNSMDEYGKSNEAGRTERTGR